MIFGLELITLEKGKNSRIRPLFGQNRRLGGRGLFRHITVMLVSNNDLESPHQCKRGTIEANGIGGKFNFNLLGVQEKFAGLSD